jgi:hypothetical protein
MSNDPIRTILLKELETITQAMTNIDEMDSNDQVHWSRRLRNVNHALQSLENTLFMTCQEKATLRLILEYHEDAFDEDSAADAPFDVRAHESLLAKVRPARG